MRACARRDFADAGLAGNQHDRALAALRLLPAAHQQRQLLVAADERCRGRAQRLEAALGTALAQYPRGCDRRRQASDLEGAEILVVEEPAGQMPRARRDHHGSRLGQRLQPRREVRRLADHRLLLRRPLADQIADHDQPGGDPDPHLQRCARRRLERRHRLDQPQPGAHRPFGIVLVGARIAEIGEHAVAHVLGDKPAGAVDDRGARAVIGADHRAQILGVEPRRQRRRADQIAEHHGQLAAFGLRLGPGCRRDRDIAGVALRGRRRHRVQQLLAVPQREAKFLELLVGKVRQSIAIDVVCGKDGGVLTEPQRFQPCGQVAHCPILVGTVNWPRCKRQSLA